MYARYIPPPKAKQPSSVNNARHVHFGEDESSSEPPAKRIKPSNGTGATTTFQANTPEEYETTAADDHKNPPQGHNQATNKSSKVKKRQDGKFHKSTRTSSEIERDIPVQLNEGEEHDRVPEPILPLPIASNHDMPEEINKRRKKDKRKKSDVEAPKESPAPDDGSSRRHKSILSKVAKAMKDAPPKTRSEPAQETKADKTNDPGTVEAQGLEPLPQPTPLEPDTSDPTYNTLPQWIRDPVKVSQLHTAPFTDFGISPELGISPKIAERLASNGYEQAFAIQTVVLPQLLPHHCISMQSDLVVSATTGSGKTLAYAIPLIRDLSHSHGGMQRLRALVVLPTRELVQQTKKVFEELGDVFALDGEWKRVRVGTAMGNQSLQREQDLLIHTEENYDPKAYKQRAERISKRKQQDEEDHQWWLTKDDRLTDLQRRIDEVETTNDHVVIHKSTVDVLICTPGRLVEHLKYTAGFSLELVRWLIVDEVDKLLGQDFQQWVDIVMPRLHGTREKEIYARAHKHTNLSRCRKVILSATMTKDLDLLASLRLRKPKLVVLEGQGNNSATSYVVPNTLEEAALRVDQELKPLFLLDLLRHITGPMEQTPSILVFTNSNESTLRLSRLLHLLAPDLESILSSLTSAPSKFTRQQIVREFTSGKLRIIVATDMASRGIDFPALEHVVNYDMPLSVESYVHRVGRTARAGKSGHAWTLFTHTQGRIFSTGIESSVINRAKKIARVRFTDRKAPDFDGKVEKYEEALKALETEVEESRRRR